MNLTRAGAVALASAVAEQAKSVSDVDLGGVDLALCPPSVYLDAVAAALSGSSVSLGAQNIYHEPSGAFTGEVSASMVVDIGCRYVILGHSERRHILGETDKDVNQKVSAALAAGLVPIVCVGELLSQREAGQTGQVISSQFDGSLAGLDRQQMSRIILAYEPVWAIGTGKVATREQAEAVHSDLRKIMENRYNSEVAQSVRILYGGSVKPDNAAGLMAEPNIDGALVGGASLKCDDFMAIAAAADGR